MTDVSDAVRVAAESMPLTGDSLHKLEARLLEYRGVSDCAVLERVDRTGDRAIVAYVVSQNAVPLAELRAFAATVGSGPMVDAIVRVSNIPLTESGDVDANSLARLPVIETTAIDAYRALLAAAPGFESATVSVEWNVPDDVPLNVDELLPREGATSARVSRQQTRAVDDPDAPASWSVGAPIASSSRGPRRLADLLSRAATEHADHRVTCVEHDGEFALSYPELLARAERILGGLRAKGLRAGDIVIFEIERNLDFIAAFWGCTLGGFVPAPISVPHGADPTSAAALKLKNAWDLLGQPYVLTSAALEPLLSSLKDGLALRALETLTVERLAEHAPDASWYDAGSDELALLLLTSGSSGKPKAVTQTHAALLAHVAANAQQHGFTSDDVPLNWLGLDHVGSIVMLHLGGVALGANQVHARTDYILQDALRWLDLIERHRATITWAPNFAFALVNDRGDDVAKRHWDLSSMRFIVNGGEAVVASTARRFLTRLIPHGLPATAMRPAWGMSETSSAEVISSRFTLQSSSDNDEFVEVGGPNPGFEIRIVDDDGRVLPEGREGHMEVRGVCVTRGYLNNPDANASAFTPDRWFRTGDLGWLRSGRMTITGREKGEIIVNGVNYPAHEVEAAVEEVAGVSSSFAAAFAVRESGAETDSLAIAFHTRVGEESALGELLRRIRQRVFDRVGVLPRFVISVEQADIPKTAIGKIQRAALTKHFAAGGFADAVRRSEQLTRRADTIPDWFFRWAWRRRSVAPLRSIDFRTVVVIVADGASVAQHIAQSVESAGGRVVLTDRADVGAAIATAAADDRLIVLVGDQFGVRPSTVLGDEPARATDAAKGLIDVTKAIASRRADGGLTELVIYDSDAQHVVASDETVIGKASVVGMLRTIPAEHPTIAVRHVDLAHVDTTSVAGAIVAELSDTRDEPEVAYRAGERWVRRLIKQPPRPAGRASALASANGFIVVAGGLGGIGVEIARHLLRTGNAPLLLLGREAADSANAAHRERLATVQSLGVVRYAKADLGNVAEVEAAIAEAEREWNRPLGCIVHVAGVFEPRLLADETDETLSAALRSKVEGGWSVHRILTARPQASFVAFSSVNGELGGYTAGAYSAANAFLDSLVQHHVDVHGRAAYSLAWTLWDSVGMSREHAFKESAARRGYRAVSIQQGMVSLAAAVASEPGQLLIGLDGTSPHIRRFVDDAPMSERVGVKISTEDGATAPAFDVDRFGVVIPSTVRAHDTYGAASVAGVGARDGQFGNEIERVIGGVWCEVLATSSVAPTENFFDIGGTSLLVATATRKMREALGGGREVAMTDIYQFPSIRLLAAHYVGDGSDDAASLDESEERGRARRAQRVDRKRRER